MDEGRNNRGTLWAVLAPLVLAGVIAPTAIRASILQGRLSLPPVYDDVSYFADAMQRVTALYDSGAAGVVRGCISHPPHSPFATGMAAAGYLIFGMGEWAPYAMNTLVLAALLAGVWGLLRGVRGWVRAVVLVAVSCVPIAWMSVTEFRPDIMAGLCTVAGVLIALDGDFVGGGARRWAWFGGALGAALLCKPSTFPATLVIFGASGVLAVLAAALERGLAPALRAGVRAALVTLGVALVIAGPYYLIGGRQAFNYVYYNMFGGGAELWMHKRPAVENLRYYVDGVGGRFMLGPYVWGLLGLAALGAVWGMRGAAVERARMAGLGAVLALAYVSESFNPMKSQFLGLPFQLLLMACALLAVRAVLTRPLRGEGPPLRGAALLPVALAVAAAAAFTVPGRWEAPGSPGVAETRRLYREISDDVASRVPRPGPKGRQQSPMLLLTFTGRINASNVQLEALRRGKILEAKSIERARSLADYGGWLDGATFVLAAPSGTGQVAEQFPSAQALDAVLAELDARPELVRLAEYPVTGTGRAMVLFGRRAAMPRAGPAGTPAAPQ